MEEYKYLRQNAFESSEKFQKRLNDECRLGWKPIAIAGPQGNVVLLQKIDKYES